MPYSFDKPINEPVKDYSPGSIEKESLKQKLFELKSQQIEVPLICLLYTSPSPRD